jgi:gamma-glutamyltranspeptidase/glutathione hydrolase
MIEGKEVVSSKGAVAAGPAEAARVGARILEAGGNAMDAAAAACLACCMLQPHSTGVGGYVMVAVVLEGRSGRVWSLDANGPAPAAAHERMYELTTEGEGLGGINGSEYQCQVKDNANVHGPLAVSVPGLVAGLGTLSERWGRLRWEDVVAPSLKLLDDGIPYGLTAGAIASLEAVIRRFEPTCRHLMPDGKVPKPDDVWHRTDMEKTLGRLASAGWRDFYEGEIGRRIADYLADAGGILTREDMAGYRPRVTEPYATTYRKARVHGPILPNGCLSSLQALNMLEVFEPVPDRTPAYWHRLAEVMKLVWRDRLRYLGDPEFVYVPVERLLNKEYAAGRSEHLRQFPDHVDGLAYRHAPEAFPETLHVSAADAEGNLVSATITHGGGFGSCVTVPGLGLILAHGMCRLDPRPGRPNSVGPRKRPLNNTAPMILRLPDRDVATGLPGGRRIVCVGAQLAQRVVDFGSTALEAASAPRLHVQDREPVVLTDSVEPSLVEEMTAMGHEVRVEGGVAGPAHCAEFLRGPRRVRAGGNTWTAGA